MRNRHVRITIAIILAAMLAIGFVAPFALATTDDANLGEIPPAVTAAIEPDGQVARHVTELAAETASPAPAGGTLAGAHLTFGPLVRFVLVAEDPAGSGLRLTRDDLADSAPQFVAVVSANGEPVDLVEIAADGSFVALGGQSERIVRAVAGAEAGSLLLRDPANSPIGSPWLPTIFVSVAVIIVIALAWALARSNRHLDL